MRERLEEVVAEMRRIVTDDLPLIEQVSGHLLQMRGKMFRPTLALLASEADGRPEPRAITLAAVVELMHLASLVHDDSVDHSALRRGLPTVNSLFSHQVSVIMGDFLYSRALEALVRSATSTIMRVLTDVANAAHDRRDAPARGGGCAGVHRGGLRGAHPGEDGVAAQRRVRDAARCAARRSHRARARAVRRAARHGVPGRRRHPRLHRDGVGDREAVGGWICGSTR